MTQAYIGQIMLAGFNFAQKNWAMCNGQIMSIAQNQALFSLLGTTYGGDGVQTFALPDLRSRTPVGGGFQSVGQQVPPYALGEIGGTESVTLLLANLPIHTHMVGATKEAATANGPGGQAFAGSAAPLYGAATAVVPLGGTPSGPAGGNQPHSNIQPYITVTMNMCLYGLYPSRN